MGDEFVRNIYTGNISNRSRSKDQVKIVSNLEKYGVYNKWGNKSLTEYKGY